MTPINILLVEDNEGDIYLTKEALGQDRVSNRIFVTRDGVEAMEYLNKSKSDPEFPLPDLILLDWNLPRMNGKETLSAIKADVSFRYVPIVVLTTSAAERDVLDAYAGHANCFITKPVDLYKFISVLRGIEDFWVSIVRLPKTFNRQ
jgi:chemotaxis family two-component system response regulator Rcp1